MSTDSVGGVAGIVAIIGAISTAIGGISGFWATKGIDAKIRLMRARKETNLEGLEAAELKTRGLQDEIRQLREDHRDCMEGHAQTREELALFRGRLEVMEALVNRSCPLLEERKAAGPEASGEQQPQRRTQ